MLSPINIKLIPSKTNIKSPHLENPENTWLQDVIWKYSNWKYFEYKNVITKKTQSSNKEPNSATLFIKFADVFGVISRIIVVNKGITIKSSTILKRITTNNS